MTVALIGFAVLLGLILLRVPLLAAMGLVGFFGFAVTQGLFTETAFFDFNWKGIVYLVARTAVSVAQSYELSVIPLFLLMGDFVAQGGLSKDLYRLAHAYFGYKRGGLAVATIVACGGFSSVCGSSLATTATMGRIAYPEMKRLNYATPLASASICAGSTLGILIPPSVILIIYGLMTEQSIRELFAAGFLPGLLGIALYVAAVKWVVWRNPALAPAGARADAGAKWRALKNVYHTVILFTVIMGGIYFGVFTPTEAAGIGAFGGFLISLFRRALTPAILIDILKNTAITSVKLFSLLIGALIFSRFISNTGVVEALSAFIDAWRVNPYLVIALMMLVYVVLGMILESLSMILLTVPLFFPLVAQLGFDLVWFGILVVVITEISLITPPVGLNVFVLSSVIRELSPKQIFRGVLPFWCADIARLLLLIALPAVSLWLPGMLY